MIHYSNLNFQSNFQGNKYVINVNVKRINILVKNHMHSVGSAAFANLATPPFWHNK